MSCGEAASRWRCFTAGFQLTVSVYVTMHPLEFLEDPPRVVIMNEVNCVQVMDGMFNCVATYRFVCFPILHWLYPPQRSSDPGTSPSARLNSSHVLIKEQKEPEEEKWLFQGMKGGKGWCVAECRWVFYLPLIRDLWKPRGLSLGTWPGPLRLAKDL